MNAATPPPSSDSAARRIGQSRRASRAAVREACGDGSGVASDPVEQLGKELAHEMAQRWRSGQRLLVEDFLAGHPELSQRPESAIDLIYEEFCLRQADGETEAELDMLRRFPKWSAALRVMLECHRRVLHAERNQPRFPAAGDCIGDFRLIAEFARGSRGRVFLAAQTALSDRPVVLKITPLDGLEHVSLARLQHTNIVPLYSAFDDIERGIRILCMPYFGCATLAWALSALAQTPMIDRSGRDLLAAIDIAGMAEIKSEGQPGARLSSPQEISGAARQMLSKVSYVQAMCWIAASLSDALQFAHDRGVVHLDLKPSNVLLAADGQPMLLDFHLSREIIRPAGAAPEHIGGTLPYMPPEQKAAMQASQDGLPIEVGVDGRADIYALGAILYESLGGQLPVAADSRPLVQINPEVSEGLSDIIARCLARSADDRYANAAALADDLRRHLTDQPLAGVPNRSLRERWRKWRRRQPGRLRSAAVFAAAFVAAAILLTSGWFTLRDRRQQAELALTEGQRQVRAGHFAEAARSFERGRNLANRIPLHPQLQHELRDQLASARRLSIAQQLHQLADEVRVLYAADTISSGRASTLASQCSAFWQKRDSILASLASEQSAEVSADLQDIAIFAADLQLKRSTGSASGALSNLAAASARSEAAGLLDEAEATFGPSLVLDHEREVHHLPTLALPPSAMPQTAPARSTARAAWEHCALGRSLLASGDLSRARESLASALKLDPAGRWPNFYYGVCCYRMARYADAVASFSVCIGASPAVAGCYYNRALAHAAMGNVEHALEDYTSALKLDPNHAAAALNRGMIHFQNGHLNAADADLRAALDHGADPATAHYDLALVQMAAHHRDAAFEHVQQALRHNPANEQARQLRDSLQRRDAK